MWRSRFSQSRGGGGQGGPSPNLPQPWQGGFSPRLHAGGGMQWPREDRAQRRGCRQMLGPSSTSASLPVLAAAPVCSGPALGCRVKEC